MTGHAHYDKAPIVEATISLDVIPQDGLPVEHLSSLREVVQGLYPTVTEEHLYTGEVSVPEPGAPAKLDDYHEHTGYRFSSEDGRQFFSARLDGFDFSVRHPYDNWESFRDEAHRLWELFLGVSGAEAVVRVAIRYINRIDIAGESQAKLDDYLHVYPEVPDDSPAGGVLSNFFVQLQLPQEDLDCLLVINQAPGRSPDESSVAIRLDFDLFRELYDDPWPVDDKPRVWGYLEKLHEREYQVFEASITDTTRRLIK